MYLASPFYQYKLQFLIFFFIQAARRLQQEKLDREDTLDEIRKQSRRAYLKKREEQKVQELEDDIADDEFLFNEEELTKDELKQREYNKKLLSLAKGEISFYLKFFNKYSTQLKFAIASFFLVSL